MTTLKFIALATMRYAFYDLFPQHKNSSSQCNSGVVFIKFYFKRHIQNITEESLFITILYIIILFVHRYVYIVVCLCVCILSTTVAMLEKREPYF